MMFTKVRNCSRKEKATARIKHLMEKIKLKLVYWIHYLIPSKICWADCVRWAYGKSLNPFKIGSAKGCEIDSKERTDKSCYCGIWNNGVCFYKLSKKEQKRIKNEMELEKIKDKLPF